MVYCKHLSVQYVVQCMAVYRVWPYNKAKQRRVSTHMKEGVEQGQVTLAIAIARAYKCQAFKATYRIDERCPVTLLQRGYIAACIFFVMHGMDAISVSIFCFV